MGDLVVVQVETLVPSDRSWWKAQIVEAVSSEVFGLGFFAEVMAGPYKGVKCFRRFHELWDRWFDFHAAPRPGALVDVWYLDRWHTGHVDSVGLIAQVPPIPELRTQPRSDHGAVESDLLVLMCDAVPTGQPWRYAYEHAMPVRSQTGGAR